jgi:Protein of unknown function (DUF2917)
VILQTWKVLEKENKMNLTSKTPKIELLLRPHQILDLVETEHRMAIECKSGVLWVTHSGESQDYMLKAGKRYTSKTKGKIVIEAINEACLDIEEN